MTDDLITYYDGLLSEQGLDVALCWTVVEPLTQPISMQTVAERLGADHAHIRERPLTAAYDAPKDAQVVYLAQAGPAVALIEFNGYQGIRQIEQLSASPRAQRLLECQRRQCAELRSIRIFAGQLRRLGPRPTPRHRHLRDR